MTKTVFSSSMTQGNNDGSANHRKLNMYMVLFHRAEQLDVTVTHLQQELFDQI